MRAKLSVQYIVLPGRNTIITYERNLCFQLGSTRCWPQTIDGLQHTSYDIAFCCLQRTFVLLYCIFIYWLACSSNHTPVHPNQPVYRLLLVGQEPYHRLIRWVSCGLSTWVMLGSPASPVVALLLLCICSQKLLYPELISSTATGYCEFRAYDAAMLQKRGFIRKWKAALLTVSATKRGSA